MHSVALKQTFSPTLLLHPLLLLRLLLLLLLHFIHLLPLPNLLPYKSSSEWKGATSGARAVALHSNNLFASTTEQRAAPVPILFLTLETEFCSEV